MRSHRTFRIAAVTLAASFVLGVPAATLVRGSTMAALPDAKRALLDASAAAHDAGMNAAKPAKDPLAAAPVSLPEPAWVTGIIDSGAAPFPGSVYAFENQWHDIVNGEHANVYAGALRSDRAQGLVALEFTALDITAPASDGGIFLTPVKAGAVRVIAANGTWLLLVADDGTQLVFDVASRTFGSL